MEKIQINVNDIVQKLSKKALDSNWRFLDWFFNHMEFPILLANLAEDLDKGFKFTPPLKDMFSGFFNCPEDKLNVIIIGQDPYPQDGVADGISFSCSKTMKEQPSLRYIFNELESIYPGYDRNPDLSRWSKQGVLMYNTALSCRVNGIGTHYEIWNFFTKSFLEYINNHKKNLIIVLLGKKAEEWEKKLSNHKIIKVSHPASAAYSGGKWNSNNLFERINQELITQGKQPIVW